MDTIQYEDFLKVEIRVGTVIKAERVPKSNKLLNLQVVFGPEIGERTILAGIGKDYDPEKLVDTQVVAVLNLEVRAMMGIQSHGMLLAAQNPEGKVVLAACPGVSNGSRLG